jgi:hypothetical protein
MVSAHTVYAHQHNGDMCCTVSTCTLAGNSNSPCCHTFSTQASTQPSTPLESVAETQIAALHAMLPSADNILDQLHMAGLNRGPAQLLPRMALRAR